jgi:hypothetical protein
MGTVMLSLPKMKKIMTYSIGMELMQLVMKWDLLRLLVVSFLKTFQSRLDIILNL